MPPELSAHVFGLHDAGRTFTLGRRRLDKSATRREIRYSNHQQRVIRGAYLFFYNVNNENR
jgi:hypothetical protein